MRGYNRRETGAITSGLTLARRMGSFALGDGFHAFFFSAFQHERLTNRETGNKEQGVRIKE